MIKYVYVIFFALLHFATAQPVAAQVLAQFGEENNDLPGLWPRPTDKRIVKIIEDIIVDYPSTLPNGLSALEALENDPVIGQDAILLRAIFTNTGEAETHATSLQLFERCVQLHPEHAGCYVWLGVYSRLGMGQSKDEVKGADYYETAAKLGSAPGQWYYGMRYLRGQGRTQDSEEAFKWIEKSARQDYIPGLTSYAIMKRKGDGTTKDEKAAFQAAARGASLGDGKSYSMLGDMFAKGYGTQKDLSLADLCVIQAASTGHKYSQDRFSEHVKGLTPAKFRRIYDGAKARQADLDRIMNSAQLPE